MLLLIIGAAAQLAAFWFAGLSGLNEGGTDRYEKDPTMFKFVRRQGSKFFAASIGLLAFSWICWGAR